MTSSSTRWVHVVAGVLVDACNRILIAKRPLAAHQGGLWEFPGGKIESGESPLAALTRELHEEVGVDVISARPLITVRHHYPDKSVELDVWLIDAFSGIAHGREGQPIEWVAKSALRDYPFPAANIPIITALNLPTMCLITGDARDNESFASALTAAVRWPGAILLYRQQHVDNIDWGVRLDLARAAALNNGQRLQVNCTAQQIDEIHPQDGVHLSAREASMLLERPIAASRLLGVSCHTPAEIQHAHRLGADYVLLSPVQHTATHPHQPALGWDVFRRCVQESHIPVYALGGLLEQDLSQAWHAGAQGIAGIGCWWQAVR